VIVLWFLVALLSVVAASPAVLMFIAWRISDPERREFVASLVPHAVTYSHPAAVALGALVVAGVAGGAI